MGLSVYDGSPSLLSTLFFPIQQDTDVLVIDRVGDTERRQGSATKLRKEMLLVNETLAKSSVRVEFAQFGKMRIHEQVVAVARSRVLVGTCGAGMGNLLFGLPGRMKVEDHIVNQMDHNSSCMGLYNVLVLTAIDSDEIVPAGGSIFSRKTIEFHRAQ